MNTDVNGQNWSVENFGCTVPALVRERKPVVKKVTPVQPEPLNRKQPIGNMIQDVPQSRSPVKRQTELFRPRIQYYPYFVPRAQYQYPQYFTY